MSFLKSLYNNSKDGLRTALVAAAVMVLCLFCLYVIEQVDQLSMRLRMAEGQIETVRLIQENNREIIRITEEFNDVQQLRLEQMHSTELERGFRLSLLDHQTSHLMRYVQATHACFFGE